MRTGILYKATLFSFLSLAACGGMVSYAAAHHEGHGIDGTLSAQYSSIKNLVDSSTVIVKAHALNQSAEEYKGVAFTNTDVRVDRVLKGGISPHSTIKVLETGGTVDGHTYSFEGVSPMKYGHDYLLFLQKYQGGIPGAEYVIVGAYQGRLDVAGDGSSILPANPDTNHFDAKTVAELMSEVQSDMKP